MLNLYLNGLVKWRWAIIVLTLLVVGVLSSGARFLTFSTDYRFFFSEDNPHLLALENLQQTYSKDDNVLIIISPKNQSVFTQEVLANIEWLTQEAWNTPYVRRVDSLQNFQHSYGEQNELIVGDLYHNSARLNERDISEIKKIALTEPLLLNRIVSPDGNVTAVNITVDFPIGKTQSAFPEVVEFTKELTNKLNQANPNLEIRLTGGVIMTNAFPEASQHDIETLIPIMLAIVLIVLALMLKSLVAMLWVLSVVLFSIALAMGTAGWFGMQLSPPSAGAPNIILTVAVADGVHMLVTYLHTMRSGWVNRLSWKEQRIQATYETLKINLSPVFLTSITTALGFLSLNFSDSPPFHDLGNIVAIGVLFAFLLSIVFLPALMIALPIKIRPYKTQGTRFMQRFSEFVILFRWRFLCGMVLLVGFLLSFLPKNELNDDLITYFAPENTFRADTEYATKHLTGMYVMEYSLPSEQPGGIYNHNYLKVLDQFSEWYRQQPEVLHVYSITDILKRLNKNMHENAQDWYQIPVSRNEAAQYMLLYEMSLPEGLDLNDRINVDRSASRMTATIKMISSKEMLALQERANQWLLVNAPYFMYSDATGQNLIFAHIGETNILSMLKGTLTALILISLLLILALKSLKLGTLSLLPNLIPALMAFGLWGLIEGQINLATSVVASLTLGIVVDDTVHFLSKFQHAHKKLFMNKIEAVNYAFQHVGTALWITSFVLIAGFLTLSFSQFELNAKMGLLTAITIAFALVADFLLLPPLLMLGSKKK